ncbi:MAG TPA: hypothetical protein IAA80_02335 [Candidatus Gallacutalibacter pullistercoris]|nr:hypothetical protein [Candidatus Gallacutalibacter pullistercoris]
MAVIVLRTWFNRLIKPTVNSSKEKKAHSTSGTPGINTSSGQEEKEYTATDARIYTTRKDGSAEEFSLISKADKNEYALPKSPKPNMSRCVNTPSSGRSAAFESVEGVIKRSGKSVF